MHLRKIMVALVLATGTLAVGAGTASAVSEPVQTQAYWRVVASYPNTTAGRYACSNAVSNFPPQHAQCLVDSENPSWINLWALY
ncbi:MAG: hypothetical protein HOV86_17200 [Thermoactinospora sp.]|nr:hypothetical protein [Thermoactinospora sp.]